MKTKCKVPEGHGHVMDRSSGLHCLKVQIRKRGNGLVLWACIPCERHPGGFEKMGQGSNILLSSRVLLDTVPSTSPTSLNCTWKHSHFADVCRAYSRQQIRKLSHTEVPKLVTSQAKIWTQFHQIQNRPEANKEASDCAKLKAGVIKANTSPGLCRANEGRSSLEEAERGPGEHMLFWKGAATNWPRLVIAMWHWGQISPYFKRILKCK